MSQSSGDKAPKDDDESGNQQANDVYGAAVLWNPKPVEQPQQAPSDQHEAHEHERRDQTDDRKPALFAPTQ